MTCLVRRYFSLSLIAAAYLLGGASLQADDEPKVFQIEGSGGVPLNVAEAGKRGAPGILLIHGNGQSYLSWYRQLESDLAQTHHLVAFDLRGHGNSGKPSQAEAYNRACIWAEDIEAVIRSTGLERPVMVGWSRGGLIAMHYVRCRGTDALSGIAMVASRGRLVEVPLPPDSSAPRSSQVDLEAQDIRANMLGAERFAELMTAEPPDPEWLKISTAMNIMAPPYARRAMRAPVLDPDGNVVGSYAGLLDQIDVPFMVVLGADDALRDSGDLAAAYRAAKPDTIIHIYPGVGHSPFLEAPARFNADLAEFAAKSRQ